MNECKLSQNCGEDTKKAHIVNLFKSIPTLVSEAHLHINNKRVGASDTDAGMP